MTGIVAATEPIFNRNVVNDRWNIIMAKSVSWKNGCDVKMCVVSLYLGVTGSGKAGSLVWLYKLCSIPSRAKSRETVLIYCIEFVKGQRGLKEKVHPQLHVFGIIYLRKSNKKSLS